MVNQTHAGSAAATANTSDEICPVCKSNRFLFRDMKFLINPECYHKMCSSCVDRLFTAGPAPCPIIGCGRTLRKKNFKEAFFEDLTIEREVDIRRRVHAVFNKTEGQFETLRQWNDYLNEVEDLIFDLTNGNDRERASAQEKLKNYAQGHKAEIEENVVEAERTREAEKQSETKEQMERAAKRMKAAREDEEAKQELERSKRATLDKLANSNEDAETITQEAQREQADKAAKKKLVKEEDVVSTDGDTGTATQKPPRVVLKKAGRRGGANAFAGLSSRGDTPSARGGDLSAEDDPNTFVIRGLKKKPVPVVEGPYDPFEGLELYLKPGMVAVQDDYDYDWLTGAKNNPLHSAGGYSLQEYYSRSMFEAFSGLGVFIEEELAVQKAADDVAEKMELDDVF